jgi:hypothetical protein
MPANDTNAPEPITVTVTPTRSDFVNFNLRYGLRRARALMFIGGFWLLAATCVAFAVVTGPFLQPGAGGYAALVPMLAMPIAVFVLLPVSTCLAARRRWHGAAELREPRRYTFTGEGIQVTGETFAAFVAWSHITTAGLSAEQVFLGTQQNLFYLIPLRAFSDGQLESFRTLVAERVEDCRL